MRAIIYFLLFISGGAALIYEIVWTRMLLLIFGVSSFSVIAVVSAFMAGLALGSYFLGRIVDHIQTKSLLWFYAIIELGIGITSLFTPSLFPLIREFYQSVYPPIFSSGIWFTLIKFALTMFALLPATILMGATVPVVIKIFRVGFGRPLAKETGRIYTANTLGALAGTLISAYVLIELFGLRAASVIGSLFNLFCALVLFLVAKTTSPNLLAGSSQVANKKSLSTSSPKKEQLLFIAFGLTGMISMAYQIVWTRLLTPITGTYIYSFALILALFLFGIMFGSFLAQKYLAKIVQVKFALGISQIGIGLGGLLSVLVLSTFYPLAALPMVALVILPATICMGTNFPLIANLPVAKSKVGGFIGRMYGINSIGSIIGPVLAGFILIPSLGSGKAVLFLFALNFLLGAILIIRSGKKTIYKKVFLGIIIVILLGTLLVIFKKPQYFYSKTLKAYFGKFRLEDYRYNYLEDDTASVLAYKNKDGSDYGLMVDGVAMSSLVDETKLMAHLPILIHDSPRDVLVIAFGIGTTYRSALSYGISVDVVDLVPSVPKMFPIFFSDALFVMQNPQGHIYINDGRNFVFLSKNEYDIIIVDPPPPVNSAGTTVLYSREFYQDGKKLLRPGGLFLEWLSYGTKKEDFQMLTKSFIEEFAYVSAFRSPNSWGMFLVGSEKAFNFDAKKAEAKLQFNTNAAIDLHEWNQALSPEKISQLYWGDKNDLTKFVGGSSEVSDNFPRTEYFLLRQNRLAPDMGDDSLPITKNQSDEN